MHWQHSAMPDADWYLLRSDGLQSVQGSPGLQLTPALHAELADAKPGATIIASDELHAIWRLRKINGVPADFHSPWQAQTLTESRNRLFIRLRQRLASRLSPQLLHDLHNPVHALSLHTDLLARLIALPDARSRAGNSLIAIRERINELACRQRALIALWLAQPQPDESPEVSMQNIVENAVRVVRGFSSLREIHIHTDKLAQLENCRPPNIPAHVECVVIALLLQVCETTAGIDDNPHELFIEVILGPDDRMHLIIRAPQSGNLMAIDALKLLLDDEPLELREENSTVVLQFG